MKPTNTNMQKQMKAIEYTSYGAPDVLHLKDMTIPTPKPNEVLIRIRATTATAADIMMRKGNPYIGRLYTGLKGPLYDKASYTWQTDRQAVMKPAVQSLSLKRVIRCLEARLAWDLMPNMPASAKAMSSPQCLTISAMQKRPLSMAALSRS